MNNDRVVNYNIGVNNLSFGVISEVISTTNHNIGVNPYHTRSNKRPRRLAGGEGLAPS